ncbi:hypothetical protein [Rossellomorea sp. BNER]|uniref:hypothetical protein n=1 Tax=Rossellomorea sp. BNER TaxID=2962031 RepID=UPI003AF2871A|nr:hypothetical protein [Rossellomorea sp. BNER]
MFKSNMVKFSILGLSLLLIFSFVSSPIAQANEIRTAVDGTGYEGSYEINEHQLDLALEIAKSDLEETTVVNKNGILSMKYDSYKEANISEEAFDRFSQLVGITNGYIKNGQAVGKGTINDVLISYNDIENKRLIEESRNGDLITPNLYIRSNIVIMNNSETNKAIKVISFGGAVAAFAAVFLITIPAAAIIAAAAGVIGSGLALCNWNDKGVILTKYSSMGWACRAR